MIEMVWLLLMLVAGAWWVRGDVVAYQRFEALTDTSDRQRTYRLWLVQSFAILVGASLISLWLAEGFSPFDSFPMVFDPAHRALQPGRDASSGDHWLPIALGLSTGVMVSVAIQWRRLKTMLKPVRGMGDALVPRNRREGAIVVLLSLNAGFSEELFFRLALPLLLFHVTGSLAVAFGVSIVCFGLAHAHYGWKGILATMAAGGMLTLIYLNHGSLLRVMVAHAVIDFIAFLIRPALADWLAWRKPPQWLALAR